MSKLCGMAKTQTENETPQVSFTLLVDEQHMKTIDVIARNEDRTKGAVVREAIRKFLNGRKRA